MSDDQSPQGKVLGDNAGVYIPQEDEDTSNVRIDFGGFVVGLYQSAMMAMGKMPHPDMPQVAMDLDSAKHTIDILSMLKEKTQGNLENEEARLLKGLIYELKVAYVEVSS